MITINLNLQIVKMVHTLIWAFFASCILAIPIFACRGSFGIVAFLVCVVLAEVVIIIVNGWACPLTRIAAKYTDDRSNNFDIYLPEWLAKNNKIIFGTMYLAGVLYAVLRWVRHRP
ncbi:MAG: hypothetical protein P4L87_19800 [Formivibrio sp.]|nr:hypothetical protein [Formivibrio sp.]